MQVSRQAISKWENGLSNPDTDNLIRLAEVLEVDMNVLINSQLTGSARETERTTQELPKDQKKTVRLLSILLAIAVCAATVFASLWAAEKYNPDNTPSAELGAPDKTEQWWDSVKMYTGLMREEVYLSATDKEKLANLVWNYHYVPKNTDDTGGEPIYGGIYIDVEYVENDVKYVWSFRPKAIGFTVIFADGKSVGSLYEADQQIFQWLNTFIEKG